MFYEELSHQFLDHPNASGIPFHIQAFPLPDPLQRHATVPERAAVARPYHTANDLPKGRFLGTDWNQQNQPLFLSANELITFR